MMRAGLFFVASLSVMAWTCVLMGVVIVAAMCVGMAVLFC